MMIYGSGCTGAGGSDIGLGEIGFKPAFFIEWEKFCKQILLERMSEGKLGVAPIFTNFRRFDGRPWRGILDLFFAGIPCPDFSIAGSRRGKHGSRNLWSDMRRIIREVEPRYVVVENVPGLFIGERAYGFQIIGELQEESYVVFKINLSASAVGAHHVRDRVFIIGIRTLQEANSSCTHSRCNRLHREEVQQQGEIKFRDEQDGNSPEMGATHGGKDWSIEPCVGRVVDGLPKGMDRTIWIEQIKALGNAVVPQVAQKIGELILRIDRDLRDLYQR